MQSRAAWTAAYIHHTSLHVHQHAARRCQERRHKLQGPALMIWSALQATAQNRASIRSDNRINRYRFVVTGGAVAAHAEMRAKTLVNTRKVLQRFCRAGSDWA